LLYYTSCIHDGNTVTHSRNNAEIVSYEDYSDVVFGLNIPQEPQILGLNRDIKRGSGLVRDNDPWFQSYRDPAHDPLFHTTAHLMRIVFSAPFRVCDADLPEYIHRDLTQTSPRLLVLAPTERLCDLIPNPKDRIERRLRVLKNHRYFFATDSPHFFRGFSKHFFTIYPYLTGHDTCCRLRDEAQQGERCHAFPASRLADNSQGFALIKVKTDVINGFVDTP